MRKGGSVLVVIGGVAGIVESVTCILSSAIGIRLNEDYSVLTFVMGCVGIVFSLALVVYGSLVFKKPSKKYLWISLASSGIGTVLASAIFVYFLIVGPIEYTTSGIRESSFDSGVVGVLWTAGWYIAIFLILGIVGGLMTLIGITNDEQVPTESTPE